MSVPSVASLTPVSAGKKPSSTSASYVLDKEVLAARMASKDLNIDDKALVISYLNSRSKTAKKAVLDRIADILVKLFGTEGGLSAVENINSRFTALHLAAVSAGIDPGEINAVAFGVSKAYLDRTDKLYSELIGDTSLKSISPEQKLELKSEIADLMDSMNRAKDQNEQANLAKLVTALSLGAVYRGISRNEYTAYIFHGMMSSLDSEMCLHIANIWLALETPEKHDEMAVKMIIGRYLADKMKRLLTSHKKYSEALNTDEYIQSKEFAFKVMDYHLTGAKINGRNQDRLFYQSILQTVFFRLSEAEISMFTDLFLSDRNGEASRKAEGILLIKTKYKTIQDKDTVRGFQYRDLAYILGIELQ